MRLRLAASLCAVALLGSGCQTAYYSAWEKLGKDKRDLLQGAVGAARDDQKEATADFKDALTTLRAAYGDKETPLEKTYDALKSDFDEAKASAKDVGERIDKLERIAADLFTEWEGETSEITDAAMRSKSRAGLQDTKKRYATLERSLRKAEASMAPVLTRFNDHVLFLKHNLNARSLGVLERESKGIERDVEALLGRMGDSIAQAETFIGELERE